LHYRPSASPSAAVVYHIRVSSIGDSSRRSAYELEPISSLSCLCYLTHPAGVPVLKRAGLTVVMSFQAPLTQKLIADALGLTTIHVNRTLRCLRLDKYVAMKGRKVTIIDFDALSLLSDFENSYLGEDARALGGVAPCRRLVGGLASRPFLLPLRARAPRLLRA